MSLFWNYCRSWNGALNSHCPTCSTPQRVPIVPYVDYARCGWCHQSREHDCNTMFIAWTCLISFADTVVAGFTVFLFSNLLRCERYMFVPLLLVPPWSLALNILVVWPLLASTLCTGLWAHALKQSPDKLSLLLAAIYELCIASLACCRGMHNVKYIAGIIVHTTVRSPWIRCPNRQKSTGRLPRGADRHKTNSTNIKSRNQQAT